MIKIWVLVVWLSTGPFASWSFNSLEECKVFGENYRTWNCIELTVEDIRG